MSDTLTKYRVHLRSVPGMWTFYEGKVDVYAEDEEQAIDRALDELRRTAFPDRPRDGWRVTKVKQR